MRIVIVAALCALGLSAQTESTPAANEVKVPRKAREFSLIEPSGKTTLLSSLKGKVVVIQFLDTTCPHCQAYSLMLSKLETELESKGFRAWGVAFNEADAKMAAAYKQTYASTFPVGYANRDSVISFLAIPNQPLGVPQIVVIDRKGQVRAQTAPNDRESPSPIRKEAELRKLVDTLLKESAGPKAPKAAQKKTTN